MRRGSSWKICTRRSSERLARVAALVLLLSAALRCAHTPPRAAPDARCERSTWSYEADHDGESQLQITATFPCPPGDALTIEDGFERFVDGLEVEADGASRRVARAAAGWRAPECARGPCVLRYRFRLREAARAHRDPMNAAEVGDAIIAPPSTWLVRPERSGARDRYRLRVRTPAGTRFVSGVEREAADAAFEASAAMLPRAPLSAFGPIRTHSLEVLGSTLEVAVLSEPPRVGDGGLLRWIETAALDVAEYFGRFPVPRALVLVIVRPGDEVSSAVALGHGGASIAISVGASLGHPELEEDWQMPHEMVHLGFPNLPRVSHWLEEGVATYVEPIARALRGHRSAVQVWDELAEGLPKGVEAVEQGLDRRATWGGTYWGGALFCLLADLEIRERTGGRRSLQDALRGILAAGGDIAASWSVPQLIQAADSATGVPVFAELHDRLGRRGERVDVGALLAELGVVRNGRSVLLRDDAPRAAVRRAITARHR